MGLSALLMFNVYGQNDTLKHEKKIKDKWGISLGVSINTLNQKHSSKKNPYPYCIYMLGGQPEIVTLDYKDKLYRNAFHDEAFDPFIQIDYRPKTKCKTIGNIHSLKTGFIINRWKNKQPPENWVQYPAGLDLNSISFKNFFLEYQYKISFLKNNKYFHPLIGLNSYFAYKQFHTICLKEIYPSDTLVDKSSIFLVQIPVGFIFTLYHFQLEINSTFNLMGFVYGHNIFNSGTIPPPFYKSEDNRYSKFIFIDRLIKDKFLVPNVQISLGYNF